jgi:hypothetical protein
MDTKLTNYVDTNQWNVPTPSLLPDCLTRHQLWDLAEFLHIYSTTRPEDPFTFRRVGSIAGELGREVRLNSSRNVGNRRGQCIPIRLITRLMHSSPADRQIQEASPEPGHPKLTNCNPPDSPQGTPERTSVTPLADVIDLEDSPPRASTTIISIDDSSPSPPTHHTSPDRPPRRTRSISWSPHRQPPLLPAVQTPPASERRVTSTPPPDELVVLETPPEGETECVLSSTPHKLGVLDTPLAGEMQATYAPSPQDLIARVHTTTYVPDPPPTPIGTLEPHSPPTVVAPGPDSTPSHAEYPMNEHSADAVIRSPPRKRTKNSREKPQEGPALRRGERSRRPPRARDASP